MSRIQARVELFKSRAETEKALGNYAPTALKMEHTQTQLIEAQILCMRWQRTSGCVREAFDAEGNEHGDDVERDYFDTAFTFAWQDPDREAEGTLAGSRVLHHIQRIP